MKLVGLIDEDFVNYKKNSMTLMFPYCDFKCDKECGMPVCQNSELATAPIIEIDTYKLVQRYINNKITSSIVFQGLDPIDSWMDMLSFIRIIRTQFCIYDDIVIYTGYNKNEILDKIDVLKQYKNIIIKYGRFIPNQEPHFDKVLGIYLASDNQYAEKI